MRRTILVLIVIIVFLVINHPKAYVYNGHKWAANGMTYKINTASFTCCDANEVINDVSLAANAWSNQTQANFKFTYGGTTTDAGMVNDGTNAIFAVAGTSPYGYVAETNWWYDGTGNLVDSDTRVFLGAVTWVTSATACTGSEEWIYQIMTHELGHALTLAHSDIATATMHSGINYCDNTENSLDPDDILAIETVYGRITSVDPTPSPSPSPTPTPVPSPPPPIGSAYLTAKGYKVKGVQKSDLVWTGLTSPTIDIFRNNLKILTNSNNVGIYTDSINKKGSATYTYKVCEYANTTNCTNGAQVIF